MALRVLKLWLMDSEKLRSDLENFLHLHNVAVCVPSAKMLVIIVVEK